MAYPAAEIVALYHERWELELGFDEVKTHTLEREEALRSTTPERVRQEVWGLAIGYNLVRLAMARVARPAGVPPVRISYRHALQFIRLFWLTAWTSSVRACSHAGSRRCTTSSPCSSCHRADPTPLPARSQDQDDQIPPQTPSTSAAVYLSERHCR